MCEKCKHTSQLRLLRIHALQPTRAKQAVIDTHIHIAFILSLHSHLCWTQCEIFRPSAFFLAFGRSVTPSLECNYSLFFRSANQHIRIRTTLADRWGVKITNAVIIAKMSRMHTLSRLRHHIKYERKSFQMAKIRKIFGRDFYRTVFAFNTRINAFWVWNEKANTWDHSSYPHLRAHFLQIAQFGRLNIANYSWMKSELAYTHFTLHFSYQAN